MQLIERSTLVPLVSSNEDRNPLVSSGFQRGSDFRDFGARASSRRVLGVGDPCDMPDSSHLQIGFYLELRSDQGLYPRF